MGTDVRGIGMALAWLLFPLVPALLGGAYQRTFNELSGPESPDPRLWGWLSWTMLAGPLLGYGFLAGATLDLPDDPGRRGWRRWLGRRSLWVGVGPWGGFLVVAAFFYLFVGLTRVFPEGATRVTNATTAWQERWPYLNQSLAVLVLATLGYGWLVPALLALSRARRLGRCRRAIGRGLAVSVGFVGSLFGSFWAITEALRPYF